MVRWLMLKFGFRDVLCMVFVLQFGIQVRYYDCQYSVEYQYCVCCVEFYLVMGECMCIYEYCWQVGGIIWFVGGYCCYQVEVFDCDMGEDYQCVEEYWVQVWQDDVQVDGWQVCIVDLGGVYDGWVDFVQVGEEQCYDEVGGLLYGGDYQVVDDLFWVYQLVEVEIFLVLVVEQFVQVQVWIEQLFLGGVGDDY